MKSIFGTDGVRGIYGEKITEEFVYDLSKSVAVYLNKTKQHSRVLVGNDTRVSAESLKKSVQKGLNEYGVDAVFAGVVSTPCVHYLSKNFNFDMAIMLTASHNTAEYNGIKLITKDGCKVSPEQEVEITQIYENIQNTSYSGEKGKSFVDENLKYAWADFLIKTINTKLDGVNIALDCANGSNYFLAPYVFEKLGANVFAINNQNRGELINHECGSTHLEAISKFTKENGCALGFAFDGDADRVNVVDEQGKALTGEELMFLCCRLLMLDGKLTKNTMITPNVTNRGIDKSLSKFNVNVLRVDVGGTAIQERAIKEGSISYGAEDNGHIVWCNYYMCSDGLLTALFLTKLYKEHGFNDILKDLTVFEQVKINVKTTEEQKRKFIEGKINESLNKINGKLDESERVIVRPSGTEPLIRIVVEGENKNRISEIGEEVEDLVKTL